MRGSSIQFPVSQLELLAVGIWREEEYVSLQKEEKVGEGSL
jgi:hypothetical protein